mmetsp:Transcript_10110/g.23719  ORF Transcript_10110/g.23719 Transcript_10110/m.23719 type:complete len:223 (+) Transcript_10110:814-1482(+)
MPWRFGCSGTLCSCESPISRMTGTSTRSSFSLWYSRSISQNASGMPVGIHETNLEMWRALAPVSDLPSLDTSATGLTTSSYSASAARPDEAGAGLPSSISYEWKIMAKSTFIHMIVMALPGQPRAPAENGMNAWPPPMAPPVLAVLPSQRSGLNSSQSSPQTSLFKWAAWMQRLTLVPALTLTVSAVLPLPLMGSSQSSMASRLTMVAGALRRKASSITAEV